MRKSIKGCYIYNMIYIQTYKPIHITPPAVFQMSISIGYSQTKEKFAYIKRLCDMDDPCTIVFLWSRIGLQS